MLNVCALHRHRGYLLGGGGCCTSRARQRGPPRSAPASPSRARSDRSATKTRRRRTQTSRRGPSRIPLGSSSFRDRCPGWDSARLSPRRTTRVKRSSAATAASSPWEAFGSQPSQRGSTGHGPHAVPTGEPPGVDRGHQRLVVRHRRRGPAPRARRRTPHPVPPGQFRRNSAARPTLTYAVKNPIPDPSWEPSCQQLDASGQNFAVSRPRVSPRFMTAFARGR